MSPLALGMTPSEVGERTEAALLSALVCAGKQILLPFGGHSRYDLAFEEGGRLVKVQCKSGCERNGVIVFPTHSVDRGNARDYREDVDLFGVYCHDRREVYLVPVHDVPPRWGSLRLDPPKNGQNLKIRWAAPYLLARDPIPPIVDPS